MLASINIKLTIMMVSVVPLVGVAAVLLVGIYENILKKVQDQVAESQVVVEEMQGINIVKAFANEWYEIARYKDRITSSKIALKGTT
jgi:ABC-type bacteriocin/lantibiotic exporter with double-glycine peptidase domain